NPARSLEEGAADRGRARNGRPPTGIRVTERHRPSGTRSWRVHFVLPERSDTRDGATHRDSGRPQPPNCRAGRTAEDDQTGKVSGVSLQMLRRIFHSHEKHKKTQKVNLENLRTEASDSVFVPFRVFCGYLSGSEYEPHGP